MFLPKLFSIAGVRTLRLQSTISMQDDHWNTKYVGRPADFMIKDQDKMTQFAHAEVLSYSSLTKAVCVTYGFGSAGLNLPMLKFSQRFQLVASQIWMVEWIISACRLRQSWSVTESMISQEIDILQPFRAAGSVAASRWKTKGICHFLTSIPMHAIFQILCQKILTKSYVVFETYGSFTYLKKKSCWSCTFATYLNFAFAIDN